MNRRMRLLSGWILVLLAGVGWIPCASGQRLVVVSQTRNALGEACRLRLHSVDLDLKTVQPGALPLSGTHLAAPLVLDRQQKGILVSSGPPWSETHTEAPIPQTALASFRGAPLAPWPEADNQTAPGWREWTIEVAEDRRTLSNLLVTARVKTDARRTWRGALATRPWPPEGLPKRTQAAGTVLPLPLMPCYVLSVEATKYIVLGADATEESVVILPVDLANKTVGAPVPFPSTPHTINVTALRGAVLDTQRHRLWILFSALVLGGDGVQPTSWLHALDSDTLEFSGPPLELPGVGIADEQPLALDQSGQCWVATRVPGSDFAYITQARLATNSLAPEQRQHWALVGIENRLRVIPEPNGDDIMISHDHWVEYWPLGERKGHQNSWNSPVAAVRWTENGVVVAEGNRIHRITLPDCTAESTVPLQSGWVIDFRNLPADTLPTPDADGDGLNDTDERKQQSNPENPDSDGDGIPDARDPHPNAPSPRLDAPADMVFPYTAVGRQLRVLRLEGHGAPDGQWGITFDNDAMPWLRMHFLTSQNTGYAYMGVDPERFDPSGVVAGTITVTLVGKRKGNRPGYRAAGSPATIQVRVAPPRDPLPTILWLWPESSDEIHPDPALSALRSVLANAPWYFSHVSRYGPVSETLAPYSIIILGAQAAAEGSLTQKALLDYVNEGGAVLFLGAHLEGEHYRDLSEWLHPLDIHVDMGTPVSGRFQARSRDGLLRHWSNYAFTNGCRIIDRRTGTSTVRVPGDEDNQVVFAARSHGYGRIALLAAPTPLGNESLAQNENRAFALDLFYWLSRAGYDVPDRDGDGLPDNVEDTNGDGAVNRTDDQLIETDGLNPDTDGDGIPDGLEDTNRNGVVDPGESDPRKADTDGDGTFDGADATPTG